MFYVYLIQSEKNRTFYIGQTADLQERLKYHNTGRSKYTRNKGPWELIAYKTFPTRSEAMKEEKRLKSIKNRKVILEEFKKS